MNLRIKRESRWSYGARKIQISIDGFIVGELWNGQEACFHLDEGVHSISFQIGRKTMAFASITAMEEIDAFITCWASLKGGVEIYSASQTIQKQMDSSQKSNAGVIVVCIVVAILILLLFAPFKITFFVLPF